MRLQKKLKIKASNYCLVKGSDSGVFAGTIKQRDGQEVLMTDARKLWYYDGVYALSQLAEEGTLLRNNRRFSVPIPEVLILDAVEILSCSKIAEESIKAVPVDDF